MSSVAAKPTGVVGSVTRLVPAVASTVAALTTVVSFLYSSGFIGRHLSNGLRASWIALSPLVDTSYALGDTIHLAATVTDQNGAVILGTRPTWTSESPSVAKVEADGTVIVKTPGTAMILAAVDGRTARAHIIVRQRVAAIHATRDSTLSVPEGEQRTASVLAFDARAHIVRGRSVAWASDDTTVATVDSSGNVTGREIGHTLVHATVDGLTAAQTVTVIATPAMVEAIDGASQHADAGTPLPRQLALRVLSKRGRPMPGATVRFRSIDGVGSAEPPVATSDEQGHVRTRWILGDLAGVQHLLVTVDGADSSTVIAAEADPVASNTRLAPIQERVIATVGTTVSDAVGIRVTDAAGRLLAGVPVTWTTLDGGSAEGMTARTDSAGEARARWVLGRRAGRQRIRAQVGNGRSVPPLTISATALAGPAHAVTVLHGDHQVARVGAELPRRIELRVVDSAGNPVSDAAITLSAAGGSLADSSARTDSAGNAAVRWRLGRVAGTYTLSARLANNSDGASAIATATASPGAPDAITLDASPSRPKSHPLERAVVARVTDMFGNPISDAAVRFTAKTGVVAPGSAVSDAQGRVRATWTLSAKAAQQQLTASVRGSDLKQTIKLESSRK